MSDSFLSVIKKEEKRIQSVFLKREVTVDVYLPIDMMDASALSLLLINDGQDLPKMNFEKLLNQLFLSNQLAPVLCIGIHAGDRLMEYGTAHMKDYMGRGAKAFSYQQFLLQELLPFIDIVYSIEQDTHKAIAGFSLGGLSAIDAVWSYPDTFSVAGVFSGSLWWRTKDLNDGYNEETDRIMHQKISSGKYTPGLRFYFTTGSLDETADRNNNGIIDSIDDTLGLIKELEWLGYKNGNDIKYTNYEDGRHDVETWGKAMPQFLLWGWGKK